MKKFFIIAVAATLVLGACSKNLIPSNTNHEIGFKTYSATPTSKAGDSFVTGTNFSEVTAANQVIGVYAYNTLAANFNDTQAPAFMNDVAVTLAGNGATASSSYSPIRYWPTDEDNNKLSFFAYYPNITGNGIAKTATTGLVDFSFTIADTKAVNDVDFMVADAVVDQAYSTNTGVVPFVFHHQLSQVNFFVVTDEEDPNTVVNIKKIKVYGINTKGNVTASYASATTTTAWSSLSTPVDFTIFEGSAELTTTAKQIGEGESGAYYCDVANGDYSYLMIPQTLGNEVVVDVVYDVVTDGVTTTNTFTGAKAKVLNTVTAGVPAAAITSWAKNQKINYTFVIGLHPIQFTATVETGWTPIAADEIVY